MGTLAELQGNPFFSADLNQPGAISAQYDSGDLVLPGTITWTGGAPSGTMTQRYRWTLTGKTVTVYWCITATVAGLLTTGAQIALPATCPVPATLANQANNSWISTGTGAMLPSLAGDPNISTSGLFKDGSGLFWLKSVTPTISAILVMGNVTYLTT